MIARWVPPVLTDNIILQAELKHQYYVLEKSRVGRLWIAMAAVLLVPAFIASIVFFVHGLISPFVSFTLIPDPLGSSLAFNAFLLLIVMNVAMTVVVTLVTLSLAANSISREKNGKTWESLLLTNVDSRRIVWGKWGATVQALWGDQWMVALLRLGLIGWFVSRFDYALPPVPFNLPPQVVHLLILTALILAYSIIDAAFTAALGVMIPLTNWSGTITYTLVLSGRVLATALSAGWLVVMAQFLILDSTWMYFMVGVGGLVGYSLLIVGALWVAQMVAVQGQVSPPQSYGE